MWRSGPSATVVILAGTMVRLPLAGIIRNPKPGLPVLLVTGYSNASATRSWHPGDAQTYELADLDQAVPALARLRQASRRQQCGRRGDRCATTAANKDSRDVRALAATSSIDVWERLMAGARVLVVDDEPLVAMLVQDWLEQLGYEALGPAATVEQAFELLAPQYPDAAIMDVTLQDGDCYPLADHLKLHNVPFAFATGRDGGAIAPRHANAPILTKPFDLEAIAGVMRHLVSRPIGA